MSRVAGEPVLETQEPSHDAPVSGRIPVQRTGGAHCAGRGAPPPPGTPPRGTSRPGSPAHGAPRPDTPSRGTPTLPAPDGAGARGRHRHPARPPRRRRRAVLVGTGVGVAVLALLVVVVIVTATRSRPAPPPPIPDQAARQAPAITAPLPPAVPAAPAALPQRPSPSPASPAPRPGPAIDPFSTAGSLWAFSRGLSGFAPINDGDVENGGLRPVAVASPTVPGRQAVMVVVPSGAKRSEVEPSGVAQHITAGRHLAFGLSYYLPPGFPVGADGFQVVWQLHDGGTNSSPPVALEITDGHLWLSNVGDHVADLGPVRAGSSLVVGLDIRFARGAGTVSVVRDGRPVVTNLAPPRGTMVDAYDYLKVGVYKHQDDADPTARLYVNDLRVCPGGAGGTVPPACRVLVGG